MKQMKFLKLAAAMLCCVFAMTVVSCDNDDDEPTFKFSPAKAEVAVGASTNVTVSGGIEPYTVESSDVKTATVKVSQNTITVTGVKKGNVTVRVSDKDKKVDMLTVTVKDKATALELDKNTVNVEVGKEEAVTVKNGTTPYTATAKDASIATASVKDGKITVKGVKAGTTTITVTDKNKLSGTISVTVK